MYNKNCKNLVLVSYPPFAGGKFIINTLGLSNGAFFQSINLVKKQLSNQFTRQEKLNYLLKKLNEAQCNTWRDLDLGCCQLFFDKFDPRVFPKEINTITNNNTGLLFLVCHNVKTFNRLKELWPSAKHIHIINTNRFINFRLNLNLDFDRKNYPDLSQNFSESDDYYFLTRADLIWNQDCFLDIDIFLDKMNNLYHDLNLIDYDEQSIKKFYHAYYNTLLRIRYV